VKPVASKVTLVACTPDPEQVIAAAASSAIRQIQEESSSKGREKAPGL